MSEPNFSRERIAGTRTVADWNSLSSGLTPGVDPASWKIAFSQFFSERISTRYFQPIEILQTNGESKGEGFSIVTLQCALIEFVAATIEGKNYRYRRKGDHPLDPDTEYSVSGKIFEDFLLKEAPFASLFNRKAAKLFYEDVRCGLLHEARTKGGWKILKASTSGLAVSAEERIVYRDDLHTCLKAFVEAYGERLLVDAKLQSALKRKFDHLCKP